MARAGRAPGRTGRRIVRRTALLYAVYATVPREQREFFGRNSHHFAGTVASCGDTPVRSVHSGLMNESPGIRATAPTTRTSSSRTSELLDRWRRSGSYPPSDRQVLTTTA